VTLSNQLRAERLKKRLTIWDLAQITHLHPSTLSHIEHGHRRAWPKQRSRIAEALGVPEARLFGETNDEAT